MTLISSPKSPTVGLALGGGGARGAAHIGVLQKLHEHEIHIHRLAGTSAGSVIAAMYAAYRDPQWVEDHYREFLDSDVFEHLGSGKILHDRDPDNVFAQIARKVQGQWVIMMALGRTSIVKRERLEKAIDYLLPVKRFEDLQIPLEVIATDLTSGDSVIHREGDLVDAVVQSSSIPGFIPPTIIGDRVLVDGGVSLPTPVTPLNSEVDITIAVDIARRFRSQKMDYNLVEIINRTDGITSVHLNDRLVALADVVIRPDVMGLHWSQFDKFDELLENGRSSVEAVLTDLKTKVSSGRRFIDRLKHWIGIRG